MPEFPSVIRGPDDVVACLRAGEIPTTEPAQILFGLAVCESDPPAHRICGVAVRSGVDAVRHPIDHRQLADLAAELSVCAVVVVSIECREAGVPDRRELRRFVQLRHRCAGEGVVLLDWIVVTHRHWWSMRERVLHEAA